LKGKPAAVIGLRPGDKILTVDGRSVKPADISTIISGSKGKPVRIMVVRDGVVVTLRAVQPESIGGAYRLGFILRGQKLGLGESVWQSVRLTGTVTREIGKSLGGLAHGKGCKDVSSPLGIGQALDQSAQHGVQDYLWVLGLISLSLALMNLLPLLPLDGGHIAFSIIEHVRGDRDRPRPVPDRDRILERRRPSRRWLRSRREWPAPGKFTSAGSRSAAARRSSSSR